MGWGLSVLLGALNAPLAQPADAPASNQPSPDQATPNQPTPSETPGQAAPVNPVVPAGTQEPEPAPPVYTQPPASLQPYEQPPYVSPQYPAEGETYGVAPFAYPDATLPYHTPYGAAYPVPYSAPPPAPPPPALGPGWSWVDTVPAGGPVVPAKRNPFRGSRFDWTHNVTTSTFGVGQDYLSSAYQVYQQSFSLFLAYFPYDGDTFRIRVAAAPGLDVALTNSDITTTQREPLFRDLPLLVGASYIVAMQPDQLLSTIVAPNLVMFLPTSKYSRNSGDYLTVSPRASLSQQLPLFGPGARAFDDIDLWLQLRYDHSFTRGATAIDDDLNRPARGNDGSATTTNVLNGGQNAKNAFRVDLSVGFSEELFGQPLTLMLNADYRLAQLYGVTPYQIGTATGPVTVEPDPDARTWRQAVGFGVDVTYQLIRSMSLALGYAACGNELCPSRGVDLGSSTYKTPFYTPHAVFWGGLVLHVDTVLDLLINGDKTNSSVLRRDLASASFTPRF